MTLPDPPILIITDQRQCAEPLEERATVLFRGGCRWLSLREKDLEPKDRHALLQRLIKIAAPFGATVGVHDDVNAALACNAALHLPSDADAASVLSVLSPNILLGRSCHSADELLTVGSTGVHYATLSPVFASIGKPGYGPLLDIADLTAVVAHASLPVLALGGITRHTLARLAGTGIGGAAIMGEAMNTVEPETWFASILEIWSRMRL